MSNPCPACKGELVAGSNFCHRCGAPVKGEARRTTARRQAIVVARWLLMVACVACGIALVLIVGYDVESVMVTGPIIAAIGLAMITVGAYSGYTGVWQLGWAHCGICALFVALVNALDWSPGDALAPFTIMGLIHVVVTAYLSSRVWNRPPPLRSPWECQKCGYLLYGLNEPRCPECGTPFDQAKLESLVPPSARC